MSLNFLKNLLGLETSQKFRDFKPRDRFLTKKIHYKKLQIKRVG